MHLFQAMMLKGSELETAESRRSAASRRASGVLPKNYGIYAGEKVFDVDEIVVATDTLSFEDYLDARCYALTVQRLLEQFVVRGRAALARAFGVTPRSGSVTCGPRWSAIADRSGPSSRTSSPRRGTSSSRAARRCVAFYSEPRNFSGC